MLVPAKFKHLAIVQLISALLVPADFAMHQPFLHKVSGVDADATRGPPYSRFPGVRKCETLEDSPPYEVSTLI